MRDSKLMNSNQQELVRLLTHLRSESVNYSEQFPNLLPALMQNTSQLNDPETERLIECFGFMLAQSGQNFVDKAIERKYSDLSHFLPEWFEPVSSSTIIKANFNINVCTNKLHIPEHTQFSLPHIKTNETLKFSNDTPCPLIPLQIEESYFAFFEDHYCLNIKMKALKTITQLKVARIFFNYNMFTDFFRFLDEIFFSKNEIKIYHQENIYKCEKKSNFLKYSFVNDFDMLIYKSNNYSNYLRNFVDYFNNYSFIDLDFTNYNINLAIDDNMCIQIPLRSYFKDLSQIKNFAHLNCFPVKNSFIRRGNPIIVKKGECPFLVFERASKGNFLGIDKVEFFKKNSIASEHELKIDYNIYKKFIVEQKSIDIVFYMKIKNKVEQDTLIMPYFKCSNLALAQSIPIHTKFSAKKFSEITFTNITIPTKVSFHTEQFYNEFFYNKLFRINENIFSTEISVQEIFSMLKFFSDISNSYKGIMHKIIEQIDIENAENRKKHRIILHQANLTRQSKSILSLNQQKYKYGGVSLVVEFINQFLKKASYSGVCHSIEIKDLT